MATYVVGDIHGGFKALKQVLERAPIKKGDTLIFIGDYVDGWSENYEVVEHIIRLKKDYFCICLMGNHDEWFFDWLKNGFEFDVWLRHGGESTKKSYENISPENRDEHINFLNSLLPYFIDTEERLFVHAGYTNKGGPAEEANKSILNTDRSLWEDAWAARKKSPSSLFYPKRLKLFKHIFIGHTPTIWLDDAATPLTAGNVTNTDSGAAFTGKLSIIDVDTGSFWQSDKLADLYPSEEGRNSVV